MERKLKIADVVSIVRSYASYEWILLSQLHELLEEHIGCRITVEQLNEVSYSNATTRLNAYMEGLRGIAEFDRVSTENPRIRAVEPSTANKDYLLYEIRQNGYMTFPEVYTSCWKQFQIELSLKNVNKIMGTSAHTIQSALTEGLQGYVLVEEETTPVEHLRITAIRSNQIEHKDQWIAFLTLCAPIYESNMWHLAAIFHKDAKKGCKEAYDKHLTLNNLQAALPGLSVVEDLICDENLIFYPSQENPKLSRDFLYHKFFSFCHKHPMLPFRVLRYKMRNFYGVELDDETMKRIFRSHDPAMRILRHKTNFPLLARKNMNVIDDESSDDVILSWIDDTDECDGTIEDDAGNDESHSKHTQTTISAVTHDLIDDLVDFLHSSGGISLLVTDLQIVIHSMKPPDAVLVTDNNLALRSAEHLTRISQGRLELYEISGLSFVRLGSPEQYDLDF